MLRKLALKTIDVVENVLMFPADVFLDACTDLRYPRFDPVGMSWPRPVRIILLPLNLVLAVWPFVVIFGSLPFMFAGIILMTPFGVVRSRLEAGDKKKEIS